MAKDVFEDIEDFYKELKYDCESIMLEEVTDGMIDAYSKRVDEAYSQFEPNYYERRYDSNGGFADRNKWDIIPTPTKDGVTLELENKARTNGSDNGYVADYIEEGRYTWKRRPDARPVYELTQSDLDNGVFDECIDKGLKNKGY